MIRALIVDDELHSRENLQMMVEAFCPDIQLVGTAENAASARSILSEEDVDLIFLDIMMPGEDGFGFLEHIDKSQFSIVFTTAHSEFALKAIKAGALDYLQKPIDIEELKAAVQKVESKSTSQSLNVSEVEQTVKNVLAQMGLSSPSTNAEIAIPTRDGLEIVKHKSIVRLEGNDSYTTIYLSDGRKFLSSKTIKVYESHLPQKYFMRIHRSHVLNLSYLKAFKRTGGNVAVLQNGDVIPVSRRKLSTFLERIQSF